MVLGMKEFNIFNVFPCIAYDKVGEMVTAKTEGKWNWLHEFYVKGNPQLTAQMSFPFPLPARNDMSIVSESSMDKKVKGERAITLDNEKNIHLHCT